ncbi:unnamed protein product, partial [Aphanomyces euteiches]
AGLSPLDPENVQAWILEDKKTGPDHADAFIAGSERDPPHTNTTSESAIVTYTESPLTTLRKRDLEYRRLHHANSPEQRDPEKRSRQLPAEYSDEDMGSDTKSDLAPSPALDASEAKPSDHSGSELSLKPRSSLEELPCWESCDEASFPTQDLVHYDGDPVSTINSLQDQASVCQQLRSGLLCNEDRFQTELHQLQQGVQSLRLLQSDFQRRVPADFSETRHLLEEIDKSNKHLSACVSDLTRENSQLTKQVLSLKEQLNRHQQELQELRTQTPETQQATQPTSVPTSSDSNEVPALVRDLNERIASLAAGLTSNMNDLKESINVMDQDKKLGQATKFTIVPSSDHQDDCEFFIRQLLETADRCQLSDNDRRSLLGLKLCSDKTPPSLRKWWISFAKTKQGETWSDVPAEFQDQFCLRTSRQKVTDLLNDSVRYEDETVRFYATRLQSIIDEVGFPADQGVNLFKLGVRHLKTESCLENTDSELKTIADCVKLLRAREVPLDDAPMPASRPKSRARSVSDTA